MGIQNDYILALAAQGTRLDKRKLDEFRNVQVEKNPIEKAEGSARVRIGDTDVIVGVKLATGEPYPDKPNEGTLIVSAELSPIASPNFEMGPPRENAIELARVVDRGIREAGAIDVKKLCITPGEKIWIVYIDIHILNHDGNLIDACSLAALSALLSAKFPEFDGEKVDWMKKTDKPMPMVQKPIAVTVNKVGPQNPSLMVDMTCEEEGVVLARLTISTVESGNVTALQKGGSHSFTLEEIDKAIGMSIAKGSELRKLL